MPSVREFDAIFYVRAVPDIRFEDGVFYIGYDIGERARFEVVLSPGTFNKAMLLADEARAQWQYGMAASGNVHQLRRKR